MTPPHRRVTTLYVYIHTPSLHDTDVPVCHKDFSVTATEVFSGHRATLHLFRLVDKLFMKGDRFILCEYTLHGEITLVVYVHMSFVHKLNLFI